MNESHPIEDIRRDVDALKHEIVGLEHRLVQVVRNAYLALTQQEGWTAAKRLEAGAALIRYFFAGRATLIIGVGFGGLLALHASFMLADQNRKLDLQNHLSVVSSEIAEAQRNSQFSQLIPPLIADISAVQTLASRGPSRITRSSNETLYDELALRVAVLTQTFQPYRWIDRRVDPAELLTPTGSGLMFEALQMLRRAYDSGFGSSAFELQSSTQARLELPLLTSDRYSPERGLLLVNLYAAKLDLRRLTRYNVTFERAFIPGARLDGIDLRGNFGPSLSKPINLRSAFLQDATLNRSRLGGVLLNGSVLIRAELGDSEAPEVQLESADLSAARLPASNFERASFVDAKLPGADLDLANLAAANFTGATGLTPDQILSACINPATTKLPPGLLPANYSVPPECCRKWSSNVDGFEVRDGRCLPR